MDNPNELTTKELFRKWLEKLQQESWQLELLISGFALYGIYESRSFISEIDLYADKISNPFFVNTLTTLLNVGWKIFFINLLVHVILRSLWIGAIGLRYVSGEIDYENLNYSDKFTKYLERKVGDYDDFIEKLERICSVLFSYTFLLFLLFLSAILYVIVGILPIIFLSENESLVKYAPYLNLLWFYPYFLFSLVVFFDFITLGGIKRVKDNTIPKLYMPLYRLYSTITLSFLYRPLLYNFIDDKYTRKLFFLSIPYIMLVTFGHRVISSTDNPHIGKSYDLRTTGLDINHHHYEDLYKLHSENGSKLSTNRYKLPDLRLNTYYQTGDINSIFIKTKRKDKNILEDIYEIDPFYVSGMRFSLFNTTKENITSKQKEIEDSYSTLFAPLLKERKELTRSIRRNKVENKLSSQNRIDSIDTYIEKLTLEKNSKLDEYHKNKHQSILDGYMNLFHFSIDGKSYQDSLNCFFSYHPNNKERGLLCHYPTAHLPKGHHTIAFERIRNYEPLKDNRIDTSFYKIPFVRK